MLTMEDRLCANEQQVAAKVVDGEAILINLSTGLYYSMDKVGGFIWSLVEQRHTLGEIAAIVSDRHDVSNEQAQADVQRIADGLLEENLVGLYTGITTSLNGIQPGQQAKMPYDRPEITKYDDMADMFALDPPLPGLAGTYSDKP